jgi:hypothetical protein
MPLASVVDSPIPIRALPRPKYRCSSPPNSPPSLDFPTPPGAGEKGKPELQTTFDLRFCILARISHALSPTPYVSDTHMMSQNPHVPSLVVYVDMGPPL